MNFREIPREEGIKTVKTQLTYLGQASIRIVTPDFSEIGNQNGNRVSYLTFSLKVPIVI